MNHDFIIESLRMYSILNYIEQPVYLVSYIEQPVYLVSYIEQPVYLVSYGMLPQQR